MVLTHSNYYWGTMKDRLKARSEIKNDYHLKACILGACLCHLLSGSYKRNFSLAIFPRELKRRIDDFTYLSLLTNDLKDSDY